MAVKCSCVGHQTDWWYSLSMLEFDCLIVTRQRTLMLLSSHLICQRLILTLKFRCPVKNFFFPKLQQIINTLELLKSFLRHHRQRETSPAAPPAAAHHDGYAVINPKPPDAVYHSALRFMNEDRFKKLHCSCRNKWAWQPLAIKIKPFSILLI